MKIGILTRFNLIGILMSLVCALILLQIVRIQNSASGRALSEKAEQNYEYRKYRIYPERGLIYDRWGSLLAGNEKVYEIGVDLSAVINPETIAATAASQLGLDYATVLAKASIPYKQGESEYVMLTDFVDPSKIDQLKQIMANYNNAGESKNISGGSKPASLSGLIWTAHLKRSYPENTIASNILGFYSFLERDKAQGYFGIEAKYNDLLAGTPKDVVVPIDPNKIQDIPTADPGANLILTIDRRIQETIENMLDKEVKSSKSDAGVVIISDPKTGEILAMATTPRLNPNEYWKYPDLFPGSESYDRAVGETYEPGSVFKVLTMAAALDTNTVKVDTPFLDTGKIEVGGITIFNWDRSAWGPQTMLGCMQHSLNVCLAWVATQLGPNKFYDYVKAFGMGHRTNIDLAGEVIYPLALPGDPEWYPVNLGTNAFGQGIAVTPIQMVMAVDALANDGKMMAPHILKAVVEKGRQYNNNPQVVGTPISAKTARTESNMLATSLEEEASDALVDGYRVSGKTGTAEIPGPGGYLDYLTNASFVGWGPTDDPQFLVYIWLKKPRTSPWGSVVAAPFFRDIVSQLVVLMNIPPDETRLKLYSK